VAVEHVFFLYYRLTLALINFVADRTSVFTLCLENRLLRTYYVSTLSVSLSSILHLYFSLLMPLRMSVFGKEEEMMMMTISLFYYLFVNSNHKYVQESCAIAKMTARCALYE